MYVTNNFPKKEKCPWCAGSYHVRHYNKFTGEVWNFKCDCCPPDKLSFVPRANLETWRKLRIDELSPEYKPEAWKEANLVGYKNS